MPDLEKLYQLIMDVNPKFSTYWARKIAERLLASGVVVLPCKIGTPAYCADDETGRVLEGWVDSYELLGDGAVYFEFATSDRTVPWVARELPLEDFGKTVFLTKEEAEKALKQMVGGGNNAQ